MISFLDMARARQTEYVDYDSFRRCFWSIPHGYSSSGLTSWITPIHTSKAGKTPKSSSASSTGTFDTRIAPCERQKHSSCKSAGRVLFA